MQAAIILYNDRINTWREMKRLDQLLDTAPTPQAVAQMAETRIRNNQAFAELQAFNDTGHFLNRHPLLAERSESALLLKLFRQDPAEFLRLHKNTLDNIKRYKSYLKRTDRKNRRTADKACLARHQERQRLFSMVMQQTAQLPGAQP